MRSPITWYGGKGLLARAIQAYVPPGGRPYCEPYCGGASLFFRRRPADAEVLNDLHEDLVNMYRCLQNPDSFKRLRHAIDWTLYSRAEFARALETLRSDERDAVRRAWAMIVAARQSLSGRITEGNWSRRFSKPSTTVWRGAASLLDAVHERLRHVQIDCQDALDAIEYWDNDEAIFYIDPPYIHSTRLKRKVYLHETDDAHHTALVDVLLNVRGCATLSCYWHEIYQPLIERGWARVDLRAVCSAAGRTRSSGLRGKGSATKKVPRVETLLINPRVQARMAPIWMQ